MSSGKTRNSPDFLQASGIMVVEHRSGTTLSALVTIMFGFFSRPQTSRLSFTGRPLVRGFDKNPNMIMTDGENVVPTCSPMLSDHGS